MSYIVEGALVVYAVVSAGFIAMLMSTRMTWFKAIEDNRRAHNRLAMEVRDKLDIQHQINMDNRRVYAFLVHATRFSHWINDNVDIMDYSIFGEHDVRLSLDDEWERGIQSNPLQDAIDKEALGPLQYDPKRNKPR